MLQIPTTLKIVSSEPDVNADGFTNTFNGIGKIKIVYENGDVYIGIVNSSNMFDGPGFYNYNSLGIYDNRGGNYYLGQFKNGEKHGKCEKEMNWGTIFEGFYQNNMRHGLGKETYRDGTWSKGFYVNNKRHGEFQFMDINGLEYSSMYIEGNPQNRASAQLREIREIRESEENEEIREIRENEEMN